MFIHVCADSLEDNSTGISPCHASFAVNMTRLIRETSIQMNSSDMEISWQIRRIHRLHRHPSHRHAPHLTIMQTPRKTMPFSIQNADKFAIIQQMHIYLPFKFRYYRQTSLQINISFYIEDKQDHINIVKGIPSPISRYIFFSPCCSTTRNKVLTK